MRKGIVLAGHIRAIFTQTALPKSAWTSKCFFIKSKIRSKSANISMMALVNFPVLVNNAQKSMEDGILHLSLKEL